MVIVMKSKVKAAVIATLVAFVLITLNEVSDSLSSRRRRSLNLVDDSNISIDSSSTLTELARAVSSFQEELHRASMLLEKEEKNQQGGDEKSSVPWDGIENAQWCQETKEEPLPYDGCKWDSFVLRFPVHGGLTNALHFIMKGALWAFQESVCFYVDENWPEVSKLARREPEENSITPFLERYFEPIGLATDHELVLEGLKHKKVVSPNYHQINQHEYGRHSGGLLPVDNPMRHKTRDVDTLKILGMENIELKKRFLRRMFRIRPQLRSLACSRLAAHGLQDEYIAMSVRRGDKILEFELVSDLQPYITKAEEAIQTHFGGVPPTIFIASDDCSVMKELRDLKPNWHFVGECDNASEAHGFVIADMVNWTPEQTDRHYEKFVTEMIAMASAKYFIGVSTTNVSYWVYFMRSMGAKDDTFKFIDTDLAVH